MRTLAEHRREQAREYARKSECPKGEKFITELFPDGYAHHEMRPHREPRWNDFFTCRYGTSRCINCGLEREEYFTSY